MTTMRPILRRVEVGWIGFWLAGALCGVLLMVGLNAVQHPTHHSNAPAAVSIPAETSAPIGERLGGITNADTAADWYLRHEFNPNAVTLPSDQAPINEGPLGQRDGSAASVVTPAGTSRIVGPGEGLNNQFVDSSDDGSPPPLDTHNGTPH
jgi:hypothetical protein